MNTKNIPVDQLKNYKLNAKKHPQSQIDGLMESIRRFGITQPAVIDKNNEIIIGHGRIEAAKKIGIKEFPCVVKDDLTDDEIKALRLIDNRISETGWDAELLGVDLDSMDFDFSKFSIDFDNVLAKRKGKKGLIDDDEVPDLEKDYNIKKGDLFVMGNHRLMNGDSTSIEDVAKLMGGGKADMVWTDPPYNVAYSGRGNKTSNTILNDDMTPEKFDDFLLKVFQAYKSAVKENAPFYVCHSSSSQIAFETSMAKTDLIVKNQIIWNKNIASMGWGDYRWKHEPIFYATYGKKDAPFYGDRTCYTVWDESWDIETIQKNLKKIAEKLDKGGSTVWTVKRESNYEHPTQKPVELVSIAVSNSSKSDDIVLDLFGGSGSTMIACEKLNRASRSMELDARYVAVILNRFEKFTGELAYRITDDGQKVNWKEAR